jgi:hypothetical protein
MKLYRNKLLLTIVVMMIVVLSIIVIFNDKSENSPTGNYLVNTKVEVIPVIFKNCSFQLYSGWNMASFYCLGMFVERSSVLDSVSDSYGAIFRYDSFDSSDPWKSYNPSLPSWTVQQLNYIDRTSGYWIYMYDDTEFNYGGVYSDSLILLNDGWNFVGYPNTKSTNITTSLNGIPFSVVKNYINTKFVPDVCQNITNNETGNITETCTYNIITDTWLVHVNNGSSNTLEQFETYRGYWLNVSGTPQWLIVR